MSGRRRAGLSPTLFPFLAVLVCTLGTLILLLALVSQNAGEIAQQKAQEHAAQQAQTDSTAEKLTIQQAETLIAQADFRVQELVSHREAQTADLEDRRDQLTHLEDHISRLRDKLKRLSDQVDAATNRTKEEVDVTAEIAEVESRLDKEEAELEKLKQEASEKKPRIVIVPHKGPNGTDRRPIYLECTQRGVQIWPEGSMISIADLLRTTPGGNPLDAALRTIRLHAMQHYGDPIPPYPLLIVRPGGTESYLAARKAMKDWDDQFGYELVPSGVDLAFNRPDPRLKRSIDQAIQVARQSQRNFSSVATSASPSGSGGGRRRLPNLSAAKLDRMGRRGGFADLRDGLANSAYGSSQIESTDYSSPGNRAMTGDQASRQLQQRMEAAAGELAATGQAGPDLGHSPGWSASLSDANVGSQRSAESSAIQNGIGRSLQNPYAGRTVGASGQSIEDPRQVNEIDGMTKGASDFGTFGSDPVRSNGEPSMREPLGSTEEAADGTNQQDLQALESESRPTRSQGAQENGAMGQLASGQASDSGQTSASATQATSSGGRQSATSQPADASQSPQPPPSMSMSRSNQAASQARPVRRQGRDWALPQELQSSVGTALVRTIRMRCDVDRFVLLPSRSSEGHTVTFGDGDVNRASLELAALVRDRIKDWGAALPGGRWQPRLEVQVMPNAEQRFHQLQMLLRGSGVDVERSR